MSKYAKKVDANQPQLVKELREAMPEASVEIRSSDGRGMPDLLVGWKGLTIPMEIKGDKGRLTQSQKDFFARYQGHAVVVRNSTECAAEIARYAYNLFAGRCHRCGGIMLREVVA
tara:strand:- start:697 stop:1041 length:345 start_codon:yes stop_codon:yes gene_type:complete